MSPSVRINSVRSVYNDGNHNAFTDLCRFGDHLYLTFRSCPDGHMLFTTSRILVLRSADGVTWQKVFSFNIPQRDVRDPHFLIFHDKLFVYSSTWWVPESGQERDINHHLGFSVWTEDGESWHGPRELHGTHGHYIWRAAAHADVAYLDARRVKGFAVATSRQDRQPITESWLLCSQDGLIWTPGPRMLPGFGGETAFLFEEDGSILALARRVGGKMTAVGRSHPPYHDWHWTDLDREIGGPMLARWGDGILAAGRKSIDRESPTTALYWLENDRLQEIAELPSGGDNSYPGFVETASGIGLFSYYSSHEGSGTSLAPSAIYLAELRRD